MRLVACSDVHLDAPFTWAGPLIGPARRRALRDTFAAIVRLVDRLDADALLIAGDLYEHDRLSSDTVRFVSRLLAELDPIPVLIAPGNHDPVVPDSLYRRADLPPNVMVFDEPVLRPPRLSPQVTIWGAAHVAPVGAGNFLEGVTVEGDGLHIGLFHGSERRGLAAQGSSKALHAPFDADDIVAAGLHHAVVGHYHLRREAPHHTYPGNPFPLHFDDGLGGAVEIEIDESGIVRRTWHDVCTSPSHEIELDVTGAGDGSELAERTRVELDGLTGVVRLTLVGELHHEVDLSEAGLDTPPEGIEAIVLRTEKVRVAYDIESLAGELSVRGLFVRSVLDDAGLDDDERRRVLVTGLRALDGRDDLGVL